MDKIFSKYYWRYRDGDKAALWDNCAENKVLFRKEAQMFKRRDDRMAKIKRLIFTIKIETKQ